MRQSFCVWIASTNPELNVGTVELNYLDEKFHEFVWINNKNTNP